MLYAVTYDIPDDRRRLRVSNLLEGYGYRVQRSVFECLLDEDPLKELTGRLKKEIDEQADRIRIYPLCKACTGKVLLMGPGEVTHEVDVYVV